MTDPLVVHRDGTTLHIRLTRPAKHNAITGPMMSVILAAVGEAGSDDDVKAIVLSGEGPSFCAGYDISDPADFDGAAGAPLRARIAAVDAKADWMRALLHSPKPLIVSAHGLCVGIGTYLALVADFVIAADDASFGLPEERFGSAGATWAYPFLIREVGLHRANEIVLTGRRFAAAEFQRYGLVNRVVAATDLDATTASLCRALATLPRDGIALNRAVKALALATIGHTAAHAFHAAIHPLAEHLPRAAEEFDFMAAVRDVGMRAAIVKRNEVFGDWWGW